MIHARFARYGAPSSGRVMGFFGLRYCLDVKTKGAKRLKKGREKSKNQTGARRGAEDIFMRMEVLEDNSSRRADRTGAAPVHRIPKTTFQSGRGSFAGARSLASSGEAAGV